MGVHGVGWRFNMNTCIFHDSFSNVESVNYLFFSALRIGIELTSTAGCHLCVLFGGGGE